MLPGLTREIDAIAKDKGLERAVLTEALEEAVVQAARREYGGEQELEAHFNAELGEIELFAFREVVEEIHNSDLEVDLESALQYDAEAEIGDEIGIKLDTSGFGRIVAQAAKQVIIQRVRDAERELVHEEYSDRKGEVVNGIVRRFDKGSIIVDLGRAEAVLPAKEQVPRETYRPNDRVRAYVAEVNKESRGPQIVLSRACIDFLLKLFAQEVPEIHEGVVTIEAAAREPGARAKIAVASRDNDVDPVGACVGMRGSRVQAVVQELRGERIDIVPWSPDPARYVCSALAPAQISKVIIDDANQSMDVIVADDQLSLAIGRRGQNVRLAVQLTGWSIDIKSESKMREVARWLSEAIAEVEGCGDPEAEILLQQGIMSLEDLAECQSELLTQLPGIDEAGAQNVKAKALALIGRRDTEEQERVVAEAEAAAQAAIIAAMPVVEEAASEETAEAVAPSEEPSETAEENADEDSSEPTNG